MNLTDEQIKKMAEQSKDFEAIAKEQRPELFRLDFKIGDYTYQFKTGSINRIKNENDLFWLGYIIDDFRLATPEEIKQHLIKEFWKRYRVGDKIISLNTCLNKSEIMRHAHFHYYTEEDYLQFYYTDTHSCTAYKQGQWAEVVKEEKAPVTLQQYKEALYIRHEHRIRYNHVPPERYTDLSLLITQFEKENNLK